MINYKKKYLKYKKKYLNLTNNKSKYLRGTKIYENFFNIHINKLSIKNNNLYNNFKPKDLITNTKEFKKYAKELINDIINLINIVQEKYNITDYEIYKYIKEYAQTCKQKETIR